MGWFSKLLGFGAKEAGEGIKATAEGISTLASGIRSAFTGELPPKAQLELANLEAKAREMQTQINIAEAQHQSVFVAGWRPFCGWVCGFALAYHFVLQPLLVFILSTAGYPIALPTFDMGSLMTILMGMLGLGTLRTTEKWKNVQKNH